MSCRPQNNAFRRDHETLTEASQETSLSKRRCWNDARWWIFALGLAVTQPNPETVCFPRCCFRNCNTTGSKKKSNSSVKSRSYYDACTSHSLDGTLAAISAITVLSHRLPKRGPLANMLMKTNGGNLSSATWDEPHLREERESQWQWEKKTNKGS